MTRAFESHTWASHGDQADGDVTCRDCGANPGHSDSELPCIASRPRITDQLSVVVMDDQSVPVSEAARMLDITRQAAYWLVWNDRIESMRADGGEYRIPIAAVKARQAMPKDARGQVMDRKRGRPKKAVDS